MSINATEDISKGPECTLVKTADGSHSLYIKDLDEHYHSIHGAIQESRHIFIDAGLKSLGTNSKTNILEIGLGTGLNALLTFIEANKLSQKIHYTAIEAFPISMSIVKDLNYVDLLSLEKDDQNNLKNFFNRLHEAEWGKEIVLSENFSLHKIKDTLQKIEFSGTFDLIYFDAFGPPVQPELWTEAIFQKIFNSSNENSILVTYCAKGEVKRILKKVGFTVESLPGPPGKREMVRAVKKQAYHLKV